MLPFTKRPGRDDSGDVVTKEDLDPPAAEAPAHEERRRKLMPSLSEDELTHLMPSKSTAVPAVGGSGSVPPPAGRPASVLPAAGRPASVPPPARSARAQQFVDEEAHTILRSGGVKVVKRSTSQPPPKMGLPTTPTTISPAAVIKATLEAAHVRRNDLIAGPPRDLLEDAADMHPSDVGLQRTLHMSGEGAVAAMPAQEVRPQAFPMSSGGPGRSAPPPSPSYPPAAQSYRHGGQAVASYPPAPMSYPGGTYPAPPPSSAASNVPGVALSPGSMPPHFMVPQAPYSDARVDPPGTSQTSRGAGRPTVSWAAALLAAGLLVGVGAVAAMQGADSVADTTASFVDPSRAQGARLASPPPQPAIPIPVAVAPEPVASPPPSEPPAPPPVAAPVAAAVPAATIAPAATTAPLPPGVIGASTPAPPPAAAPPAPVTEAVAKVEPKPAPAPAAVSKPPARAWSPPAQASKPAADEVAASEPKEPKKAPAKRSGKGEDDEMKRALEQLQKSQLERSLGE